MKTKTTCENCGFYQVFYTRGYFKFWTEERGLCLNSQKVVEGQSVCNCHKLQNMSIQTLIDLLPNAVQDVNQLLDIFRAAE